MFLEAISIQTANYGSFGGADQAARNFPGEQELNKLLKALSGLLKLGCS